MKIERMTEIETPFIKVGDRIHVDHYTATCQTVTPNGALFFLDQYLDKAFPMNGDDTNKGGYEKSDLRKALRSDEVLNIFAGIRDYMVPFENGDLLRIPFAGELFDKLPDWCGDPEWGWLANTFRDTSTGFCYVSVYGGASDWLASDAIGVRPVFQIANEIYKKKEISE